MHPSSLQITARGRVVLSVVSVDKITSNSSLSSYHPDSRINKDVMIYLSPEYINCMGKHITFSESDIEKVRQFFSSLLGKHISTKFYILCMYNHKHLHMDFTYNVLYLYVLQAIRFALLWMCVSIFYQFNLLLCDVWWWCGCERINLAWKCIHNNVLHSIERSKVCTLRYRDHTMANVFSINQQNWFWKIQFPYGTTTIQICARP